MKSKSLFPIVSAVVFFFASAATAARVDMNDPKRAVGRDDDIRVDAQLTDDTVASGQPLSVTYQIENLSKEPIAFAEKVCEASYDADSSTITLTIGSEVPSSGEMPRLVTLAPGERKTAMAGAILHIGAAALRAAGRAAPRFVQIKINILRNLAAFRTLIEQQTKTTVPVKLTDAQFEQWLEANDSIFLNAIPVRFDAAPRSAFADATERSGSRNGSH